MDLIQVDVVGPEAAQAVLHFGDDPATRGTTLERRLAHRHADLGCQDEAVSTACQQPPELALRSARALFGTTTIDVGRVDEGDALLQGFVEDQARRLVAEPAGEVVGSEPHCRNEQSRVAEPPQFHAAPPWCQAWIKPTRKVDGPQVPAGRRCVVGPRQRRVHAPGRLDEAGGAPGP